MTVVIASTIHYRMHPGNVGRLEPAGIDVCALANNGGAQANGHRTIA
jgi:hypothetical protein